MIKKVLIANRGEIAVRIIRACREMGIETVAVYSEADKEALHTQLADEAICIGPAPSSESYLNMEQIISATIVSGADAIHPGFGFLSENTKFAELCEKCNIIFIGPDSKVISRLGNKSEARNTMANAGVPIIPGSREAIYDAAKGKEVAREIGYPVIVKAALGGGGKGMRVAENEAGFDMAFRTAQKETKAAFGDDTMYIEHFVQHPKHIEFQIMADKYGNVVHLGERDCSIQRNHQKMIEESPCAVISDELRRRMGEAAVKAAKAAHYENAGTIEFLLEKSGKFYFMEMNTRIQVEHPVTEWVTGLNIAIKGILNPGDHVISTVLEHNSVLRPLYEMEKKGVEVTFLGCDEKGTLDYADFDKAIKENTKAIVCTHGSNLTGNKVDVERIGEIAKKHDLLFVVDASQTAGVFPIDVQKMHIDILCFTGHKGLLGPQGTGGMYVRKGVHVRPLLSGGTGVQTYSKTQPEEMPTALEAGTLNGHGIAGLDAAIGYLEETGIDTIRAKEQALMKRFYEGIKEIPGVKIYGDFSSMDRCAVVSLNIRDYDSGEVSDALLTDYGISTRSGGHCAPLMHEALGTVEQGAVRFSFSHYNTEEEVDTAIRAICELAEEE